MHTLTFFVYQITIFESRFIAYKLTQTFILQLQTAKNTSIRLRFVTTNYLIRIVPNHVITCDDKSPEL